MEVGEAAAAAAGEGALGAHIDFCHFCLSLATPPLPQLSLFTSLHVTHTWMRTRTHVKVWSDYTKEGGKEREELSISFLRRTAAGSTAGSLSIRTNPAHTPLPPKLLKQLSTCNTRAVKTIDRRLGCILKRRELISIWRIDDYSLDRSQQLLSVSGQS